MIHKAWCSIEEVLYYFSRSYIIFQGHTGWKIDDLDQIWARLVGRSQLSNSSDLPCLFPESNFSLALNINSKLKWHNTLYMCRSLLIFSNVNFKMAARQPNWFFCLQTLTLVWLWIPTTNLSGTILIYMGRSLLIFSGITFKMAAWWSY